MNTTKKNLQRIFVTTFFLLSVSLLQLHAQSRTIKGTVRDSENKTPLSGATVAVKGTTTGTLVNEEGNYSITVNGEGQVLVFRLMGYKTQEVSVAKQTTIDVSLTENSVLLGEVVVTALGITREEKSLGYSVSKLNNEELTSSLSSNWMNAMSGKVAGLVLDNSGSGPGGSMRVTLRGDQSLNYGANEALFVIDGVPIASNRIASGSGSLMSNIDAPVDFGGGSNDVNPDDVESVTVLKGPSATALYGSRAANGAIIITTKSGRSQKGIGITINSSTVFEKAGFWPDFQKEYGSGSDLGVVPYGFWTLTASQAQDGKAVSRHYSRYAFGEKFDPNKLRYQYASKNWDTNKYAPTPWVYQDDWYTGLFETGVNKVNAISIDGNNGKGFSGRLSVTDTRNEWILPNTGYQQQVISATTNTVLNKYVKLSTKINYLHKESDNYPIAGYGSSSPTYSLVWGFNTNSIKNYRDEYFLGRFNYVNWSGLGSNGNALVYPNASTYNPYRSLYEELNTQDKDRIYGNIKISVSLYKGLTLDVKSGLDMNNEFRTQRKPFYTTSRLDGFYREQGHLQYEVNNDFLLRYENNKLVDNRLGFNISFGGNSMSNKYRQNRITLEKLDVEGVYNVNNSPAGIQPTPYNYRSRKAVNSLYGFTSLSWDDTYYLDVTGRNDWSSTLARGNWSFFYPSVSASILLSNLLDFKTHAPYVDFAKLRLSWANVGNDTSPYNLDQSYSTTDYPGGYALSGTIPDPLIKPENIESWEAGLEAKFLRNRLGFDVTVYNSSTTNQIIAAAIDQITGATSMRINVGEIRNRGIELSAHLVPIKTRNFSWSIDANWSKIWNELVSLQGDWDPNTPLQTISVSNYTYINSFVGEEMHVIYGKRLQRAPEGAFYLDGNGNKIDVSGMDIVDNAGLPVLEDSPNSRIGKVNPDWRGGLTTRFTYKNFSLGMTFTGQWGGNCYSVTNFALAIQGKLTNSLKGRNDGLIHPGVHQTINTDGTISYTPNDIVTNDLYTYYSNRMYIRENTEANTFSTSFLKFKEVRLDYKMSKKLLKTIGFIQGASIGVYATNIFCITDFPQYDPEAGTMNGTDIYKGVEAMTFPMTRTFGVNLKLSF